MSTQQQQVYEQLRGHLLAGRYKPGEKLREHRLAAELGVNRNPVREALLKLAGEGFLHRQAGLGCRVAALDVELFRDAWELRESIEGMAARLAAVRIQPAELIRLEHQLELMRRFATPGLNADLIKADNDFHQMLVEFSGNKALREVWRQYLVRIVAMQTILMPASYPAPQSDHVKTLSDHGRILRALRARDPDAAERAARGHIAKSLGKLLALWSQRRPGDRSKASELGAEE